VIERTVARVIRHKIRQLGRRRCVSFSVLQFFPSVIERPNLCDRAHYLTVATFQHFRPFMSSPFIFILLFNFLLFLFSCEETFRHPMDHVHIAMTVITMLEIVLQQNNFLIILTGI
jgi:hypothetical protein